VEALAAGKPVVVTKGTWLAEQALQANVGSQFQDGNAQDLQRAILEIVSRLDEYRQRAMLHRNEWVRFHNPSQMVEMLLA
jgi:glycosyltransferase involved in cell wall biosynthesis